MAQNAKGGNDMPKLKVTLSIGVGVRHEDVIEIEESEWESCETDDEREKLIDLHACEWANNYIDIGAQIVEEG